MKKILLIMTGLVLGVGVVLALVVQTGKKTEEVTEIIVDIPNTQIVSSPKKTEPVIEYVGPRENIPADAPVAYGFWSFAIPVTGVLSRSGQPLIGEFEWLKEQGWQGDVNLRVDGERDEMGDDSKLPGFNELGLNYLHLPLVDGHPPTEEQAEEFLAFVNNPVNQPTHVHCRGGIGRAGTMVVLYRYAVQSWPLAKAIEESRPFKGGISELQKTWLEQWAENHLPGSHVVTAL